MRFISFLIARYSGTIYVQNYFDYRYIQRYVKRDIFWVPGSGAQPRKLGSANNYFTISRNKKIKYQLTELNEFTSMCSKPINIVGVDIPLESDALICCGWVDQENILTYGDKFVWAGGYGDGFPHSLADSLYNNICVYIKKSEYVKFGLKHIVEEKKYLKNNWVKIIRSDKKLIDANVVNNLYASCVEKWILSE